MERLGALQARITSIAELGQVVSAMRALAAARMQQAADRLDGARRYAEIVGAALAQGLALAGDLVSTPPPKPQLRALLLFTAEHGFVGGYAEQLARAAQAERPDRLYVAGTRGMRALAESGGVPDWTMAMTAHAAGIAEMARQLTAELAARFQAGEFLRLDVMGGKLESGGRWRVDCAPLLPRPPPALPARNAPLIHLPPGDLLTRLVEETLLADIAAAAAEALAAENAARLQAMSAAADNIDRRLDDLRGRERTLRQEQITEELLDILNGTEALKRTPPSKTAIAPDHPAGGSRT
jgi:F-type H+-transporting ATPase subunit gamma